MNHIKFYTILLIASTFLISCSEDETPINIPNNGTFTIWDGATVNFTKENGSDPNNALNQDRITENVWITRGNDGGQIFNIKVENVANKGNSPVGTLWAQGTLNQVENLQFQSFRNAVGSPKSVVDKDLVLFLVDEEVYLSLKFTQWTEGKEGGFAYQRSAE